MMTGVNQRWTKVSLVVSSSVWMCYCDLRMIPAGNNLDSDAQEERFGHGIFISLLDI